MCRFLQIILFILQRVFREGWSLRSFFIRKVMACTRAELRSRAFGWCLIPPYNIKRLRFQIHQLREDASRQVQRCGIFLPNLTRGQSSALCSNSDVKTARISGFYFVSKCFPFLRHPVQIFILLPPGRAAHWRLGCLRLFPTGLNLVARTLLE